jgi:hypothetical protein
MQKRKRCRNKDCGELFTPCPQVPHQEYCSKKECQRARKREWNRKKLASDEDYREARRDAQKNWREKNPDYWKQYRARQKDYVQKNRLQQQTRNRKRQQVDLDNRIAKTDESSVKNTVLTGRYRLISVRDDMIAKTDESIVEITAISTR